MKRFYLMNLMIMMGCVSVAAEGQKVPFSVDTFLQRVCRVTVSTDTQELNSLSQAAAQNGKIVAESVANCLSDKSISEDTRTKYAWVLGLAKQDSSVPVLCEMLQNANPTSMLYHATTRALVTIGGESAGACLLENYRKHKSKMSEDQKSGAILALAMLKYAPAVREAEETLKIDPETFFFEGSIIFGLFDEVGVPLLCEKLGDPNGLVRTNALNAIKFMMPDSELVSQTLIKRLAVEKDPEIRYQMIEGLEWNLMARGEKGRKELMELFRKLLKSEDKDSVAATFMRETFETKGVIPKELRASFHPNAAKFEAAYKALLDDEVRLYAHQQAATDVIYCATLKDVPKLRELRRRALYRQSDECLNDYRRLTQGIFRVLLCAPVAK